MEGIHGVDTSWLHHSRGQQRTTSSVPPEPATNHHEAATTDVVDEKAAGGQVKQNPAANGVNGVSHAHEEAKTNGQQHGHHLSLPHIGRKSSEKEISAPLPAVSPTSVTSTTPATTNGSSTPPSKGGKEPPAKSTSPSPSRKSSWISSLSSKFTSSRDKELKEQAHQAQTNASTNKSTTSPKTENADPLATAGKETKPETVLAAPSHKPVGFLSSALRRFSSSSGTGVTKTVPNGGVCPRKVMNVDPFRERCDISDFQPSKLRRVAFCVDVEIAATPKYRDDSPEDPTVTTVEKKKTNGVDKEKKNKAKVKERSEGEALKNPNAMAEEKEKRNNSSSSADDVPVKPTEAGEVPKPEGPAKTTRQPSPPKKQSSTPAETKPKKAVASSLHHDFGPNGMFEVDDFDEIPEQKPKIEKRRGSTGGSIHHDFGRNGMFEIPSSEDEAKKPKSSAAKRRDSGNSASSISPNRRPGSAGWMPPGLKSADHLMLEIPDDDAPLSSAIEEAARNTDLTKDPATVVEETKEKLAANAATTTTTETAAADEPKKEDDKNDGEEQTVNGQSAQKPAENGAPPMTRKKEKKKKSEEERKERKERKRQAAIANGTIPVELTGDDAPGNTTGHQISNKPKAVQNRPTTDPLRIYKRCCSLRETTPLARIVEQLSSPAICDPLNPAIVLCLDLSGETIQMKDLVTLGDWLGVVPVQKLMLEGCGLNDESVRIVLCGLLAVKTSEQTRHNRHLAKKGAEKAKDKKERKGIISKLSLKNNKMIGRQGWMHIAYFLNMSRSLKAIDLSMIPFPKKPPPPRIPTPPPPSTAKDTESPPRSRQESINSTELGPPDPFDLFARCIADRRGSEQLEEIVMGECELSADRIEKLIDAVIACKCSRFGLAHNGLDTRGLQAIARYLRSGMCVGLDLGGNDLSDHENLKIIVDAIDYSENSMYALSLAHTNISTSHLKLILPAFARLPEFRFFDFSHNRKLFEEQPNAIGVLRRWLPRMNQLKRFHLNDVSLSSDDAIALAEICPEMPAIAHVSILENPALTALANAKEEETQEEACALYASLMAAARVSKTIVCIDIDVPGKENSEVVKALAKQVVAYSLRNMERGDAYKSAAALIAEPHGGEKAVSVPDVLLHLVGHVDNFEENHDDDPPAPDQDYLVGGTGVVKALSVVLGNKSKDLRRLSRDVTPVQSGSNTPKLGDGAFSERKAREMSKNLLDSARKIRHRLQPAIVRARAGASEDSENYRRLYYLDATLERMIQRFEEEYPECRPARPRSMVVPASNAVTSAPEPNLPPSDHAPDQESPDECAIAGDEDDMEESMASSLRRSRHGSDVSLASRNLVNEEGRIHRFGSRVKREILPPVHIVDHHWGTSGDGVEPKHLNDLRKRLEVMDSDEIRKDVENKGVDAVLREMNATVESLKELEREGGGAWEKCRKAGMCNVDGLAIHTNTNGHGTGSGSADEKTNQAIDDDSDSGLDFSTPA